MIKINPPNIAKARIKIAKSFESKLDDAVAVTKIHTPVDTSSLQTSVQGDITVRGKSIHLRIKAGGEDYSAQLMSTGQIGNVVDYAADQNDIHQFMEKGLDYLLDIIY